MCSMTVLYCNIFKNLYHQELTEFKKNIISQVFFFLIGHYKHFFPCPSETNIFDTSELTLFLNTTTTFNFVGPNDFKMMIKRY